MGMCKMHQYKDTGDQKWHLRLVSVVLCHSEHSHLTLPAFWNFCPCCSYCKAHYIPESHTLLSVVNVFEFSLCSYFHLFQLLNILLFLPYYCPRQTLLSPGGTQVCRCESWVLLSWCPFHPNSNISPHDICCECHRQPCRMSPSAPTWEPVLMHYFGRRPIGAQSRAP